MVTNRRQAPFKNLKYPMVPLQAHYSTPRQLGAEFQTVRAELQLQVFLKQSKQEHSIYTSQLIFSPYSVKAGA